ncbi:MAG: efflux RND transporter permease subunit [Phycisphaerales bacterium]|nr:MAG: efflux RND transporter permease subunit [Phycisphaerales bacterium]
MQLLRGLIAGGVRNPVFVNLLMVCMLAGGLLSARGMVREVFPEFSLDHLAIDVVYPGASPEDVERAICTPIEEAVQGISGVRKISSSAHENYGTVWVGLLHNVKDPQAVLDEVRARVDQITTFPPEAEKPVARETVIRTEVVNIAIYGNVPERTLKRYAQEVRDDLESLPEISQVSLSGVREDEITIEVSEEALLAYNLSLARVMAVVAKSSLDLPAGVIRTADEEFTLRVTGQRYLAREYEDLVVLEHGDAAVRLGDIATVREGFEEAVVRGSFNGRPAAVVQVFKTPEEDTTEIAGIVRQYVVDRQPHLPERLRMSVWADGSHDIDSRISMLIENGLWGVLLVFVTLALFLELRLAFWVALGIPVSFGGAMIIMGAYGETLNMISLFALIMTSGIIVDDAIVISESVHSRRRAGDIPELASIEGTHRMALPVLGASVTTIAAFVPLLYVIGVMGRFIHVLPVVVIATIVSSAIEAFGILPAHLCHRDPPGVEVKRRGPNRVRRTVEGFITRLITRRYRPVYRLAMQYRPVTLSIALGGLLIIAGVVFGGRTPFVLLPKEDGNMLRARVRFPEGTPVSVTQRTVDRLERAARQLNGDPGLVPASEGELVRQVYSIIGEFADFMSVRGNNLCEVRVELMPAEKRRIPDEQIVERWRENIGTIHDATKVTLGRQPIGPMDRPVEIRLLGYDLDDMTEASRRIQAKLVEFDGLYDISHDLIPGKRELRVKLKPQARALGLTLDDVARQLRYGFYGGEAIRLQRGQDQVKVRVRFPAEERRSITDLESVRITTPSGFEVPFLEVGDVEWARGYAYIMHQDGKRRVRVVSDIDERRANAEQVLQTLEMGFLDDVISDFNDLTYDLGGNRERMNEALGSLFNGFVMAMIAIYAILAAMLRSYIQPVAILSAVPFGLIGVVAGHAVLGYDLTIMSVFGAVALSGIVVNDSLVLLDAVNRGIREGKSVCNAVFEAGELRFRAVTLTTITTVAGLTPILMERSSQAQSVKPMAVALCAGLLFATVLTLFVVPALYLLLNDVRRFAHWLRYGGSYPRAELVEEAARERMLPAG